MSILKSPLARAKSAFSNVFSGIKSGVSKLVSTLGGGSSSSYAGVIPATKTPAKTITSTALNNNPTNVAYLSNQLATGGLSGQSKIVPQVYPGSTGPGSNQNV